MAQKGAFSPSPAQQRPQPPPKQLRAEKSTKGDPRREQRRSTGQDGHTTRAIAERRAAEEARRVQRKALEAMAPPITWDEWRRTHAHCPSGYITSAGQLRIVLASMGMGSLYTEVDLHKAMELNSDKIDFEGLLRVVRYLKAKFFEPEPPDMDTRRAFAAVGGADPEMDPSAGAETTVQALQVSCDQFGLVVDQDRLAQYDTDGDGSIDYVEFAKLFEQGEEEKQRDDEDKRFLGTDSEGQTPRQRGLKPGGPPKRKPEPDKTEDSVWFSESRRDYMSPVASPSPPRCRVPTDPAVLCELLRPPPPSAGMEGYFAGRARQRNRLKPTGREPTGPKSGMHVLASSQVAPAAPGAEAAAADGPPAAASPPAGRSPTRARRKREQDALPPLKLHGAVFSQRSGLVVHAPSPQTELGHSGSRILASIERRMEELKGKGKGPSPRRARPPPRRPPPPGGGGGDGGGGGGGEELSPRQPLYPAPPPGRRPSLTGRAGGAEGKGAAPAWRGSGRPHAFRAKAPLGR